MKTYKLLFERSIVATLDLPTPLEFCADEKLIDSITASFTKQLKQDQVKFDTVGPIYYNGVTIRIVAYSREPSYKFAIKSTGFTREDK